MNLRHWVPNPFVPAAAHIHAKALCMPVSLTSNGLRVQSIASYKSISKET